MASDDGDQDEVLQALANLQLPHMPQNLSFSNQQQHHDELPAIRILVVADIDLPSSAALAEYCLQQRNKAFDASQIDVCVCAGPFCRDEDAMPYLSGKQRLRKLNASLEPAHYPPHDHDNGNFDSSSHGVNGRNFRLSTPFARTREETSGLEGLLTASLSQLESIVCRVVYCPGASDPITSMVADSSSSAQSSLSYGRRRRDESQRLTPNSRNINKQWLPLAPALGCAGLLYLDSTDTAIRNAFPKRYQERRRMSNTMSNGDANHLSDSLSEDDDGSDDEMEQMAELLIKSQQRSKGYIPTLKRLLQLAPPPHNPLLFGRQRSQSILVTHYVDYNALGQDSDSPANGSPSWAVDSPPPSPWPQGYDEFCNNPTTQRLLCLEIASGTSNLRKAESKKRGNVHVLFPGSLRGRGEFAIVDLAVQPSDYESSSSDEVKKKKDEADGRFMWQVTNVDFHNINHLPL